MEFPATPIVKPEGTVNIIVTAICARNLKNTEMMTKQDPYMTLQMGDANKVNNDTGRECKTRTHKDGGVNADWGDKFLFAVSDMDAAILTLEVFNECMVNDSAIGRLRINIKDVFADNPMWDREFEESFELIDRHDVSKSTGDVLLRFLFHNEAAAAASASALAAATAAAKAATAAAAAATAEAAAIAERAQQAAAAAGSTHAYMMPVQNADVYFPPFVPPEVAAFNSDTAGAKAVSPEGKL